MLGLEQHWGTAGLTASAGLAGWIEFLLLKASLNRRIGKTALGFQFQLQLWTIGIIGAGFAYAAKVYAIPNWHPIVKAALVLSIYGFIYLGGAFALKIPETQSLLNRLRRRRR